MERASLTAWVKQHSRMSVHTLRRRLRLTENEADGLITELVQGHVLGREPEGESYRVLYRHQLYLRNIVRTRQAAA